MEKEVKSPYRWVYEEHNGYAFIFMPVPKPPTPGQVLEVPPYDGKLWQEGDPEWRWLSTCLGTGDKFEVARKVAEKWFQEYGGCRWVE